jgi:sugar phosphate isomerase/epimerase
MKTIKGPGIFLAQFARPEPPFNTLPGIARWAREKGFVGVQIPTGEASLFDLRKAAESDAYCDEITGILKDAGASHRPRSAAIRRRGRNGRSTK